jgi:hypothetical protein
MSKSGLPRVWIMACVAFATSVAAAQGCSSNDGVASGAGGTGAGSSSATSVTVSVTSTGVTTSVSATQSSVSSGGETSSGAGGAGDCAGCETVAALPPSSAPRGLFVDEAFVYWTNTGTGEVMQAKLDGSDPLTLAKDQGVPYAVKARDGFVYWISYSVDGVLRKAPVGGGAVVDVVPAPAAVDLAVGASFIWWTREPDDVQRVPITGLGDAGEPDILSMNPLAGAMTADAAGIYWANRQDGYVKRADLDLANETPIANGDNPSGIAVDEVSVYWTERGSGKVMKTAKAGGGSPVTIAKAQAGPRGIAVDEASVYWANADDGTIHRASIKGDGAGDAVIARGQREPVNVAASGSFVYWTNKGGDTVMRAPKK